MSADPLYQRVKERIREDILRAGESGERLPAERELQARYQVSRPTISKALAALAAEGFLTKQQRRGLFAASPPAEAPSVSAMPPLLGYIAPLAGEELVQRAFRGIDSAAHRRNARVVMGNAGNEVARERATVMEFLAAGVSGLIINPYPRTRDEAVHDYLCTEPLNVPVVLVGACTPEQGYAQVTFDNQRAGYELTDWLIGEGHRRVALLSYVERILHRSLENRLNGYRDALLDHSLPFDPLLVRRFDSSQDHIPALIEILNDWERLSDPPTAIIAPEDMAALELIDLLQLRGVAVPETIMVAGFDNRSAGRRMWPPFPTTNPSFERLGEVACDLLLQQIEKGEQFHTSILLDVPLLVRGSSRTQAVRRLAVSQS